MGSFLKLIELFILLWLSLIYRAQLKKRVVKGYNMGVKYPTRQYIWRKKWSLRP